MPQKNNASFKKPAAKKGASIACFCGHEILLIKRGKPPRMGEWSLPGGHVELNEAAELAAKRELYEETNICCKILEFSQKINVESPNQNYEISLFIAQLSEKPKTAMAKDDAEELLWIDESQFKQLEKISHDTRELIKNLFQAIKA